MSIHGFPERIDHTTDPGLRRRKLLRAIKQYPITQRQTVGCAIGEDGHAMLSQHDDLAPQLIACCADRHKVTQPGDIGQPPHMNQSAIDIGDPPDPAMSLNASELGLQTIETGFHESLLGPFS